MSDDLLPKRGLPYLRTPLLFHGRTQSWNGRSPESAIFQTVFMDELAVGFEPTT